MTQEIITITVEAGQMTARRKYRKIAQRRPVPVWAIVKYAALTIAGIMLFREGAARALAYSFNITAAEWVKLLNGSHTLKIVAADNYGGSATRTYTFTKNETEIELTLATPLTADDMVTKGIMSVVRQIPAGARFTVEVCNNGNDASPTWEDVTQNVVSGSKFFLSNTTKTASAWGYNFRIKVKRGTATGDCFITSAGGNFE